MEKLFKTVNGNEVPDITEIAIHLIRFLEKHRNPSNETIYIEFKTGIRGIELNITFFYNQNTSNCSLNLYNWQTVERAKKVIELSKAFILGKMSFGELYKTCYE